ncbi:FAD binding domain of DNA photolyase-domain-containing protein [Roridomyces roridus]|uniref:FAD binding domain of DNA photolyase-domain-containing protein n=1 Tax=Roridomyces roridus TaxID=1738132 RepID=A0AAD7C523_9AGAR|nr:FAD binding domain of DNA photolyase-domain-containing protein [Roridomyces roridus]
MSLNAMKRKLSNAAAASPSKKQCLAAFRPNKIATPEAAAAVDANPPLPLLLKAVQDVGSKSPRDSVVFWMRMGDLRISDNRGLSLASTRARKDGVPLVALFLFSPQDYIAHDRGARRIDFTLRNLALIRQDLAKLNIPLHTITESSRRAVPQTIASFLQDEMNASAVYANIEYEVDELRRDISICEILKAKEISSIFVHDKCRFHSRIVEPGVAVKKDNTSYAVYTPYQKVWLSQLNGNIPHFLENCPKPHPNEDSVRKSTRFGPLFDTAVPESLPGFELDKANRAKMEQVWPAGESAALQVLQRFLSTKARSCQLGAVDPLADGAVEGKGRNRITVYDAERDRADRDTTSRVISARACVRATLSPDDPDKMPGPKVKVDGGRTTGVGRWVQELAWRDFYVSVLTGFPRVSMGRPFLEKYADVVWEGPSLEGAYKEKDEDAPAPADLKTAEENIEKWKAGKTGVPIVDAAMRCVNEMGWVHNRMRMISAMFLVKDLMVDWRVGEKYFMENLIDGDLASNNGGWQWSASTGVDPCPYFRIFNPYTQSQKADPTGDFIRHWVPELGGIRGPGKYCPLHVSRHSHDPLDLHNPSASAADKLGYPRPVIKHEEGRERALRRFKNPGSV